MPYTFKLNPDWKLINALGQIEKFGGRWTPIEKREGQSLMQLKSMATVMSVGASTRIEGSRMTDAEVGVLLYNLKVSTLDERDQQEVAGYFEALDTISESYFDIELSESTITGIHNILMRYSKKDEWHKGNYKQHSNVVEAKRLDGTTYEVFKPTAPGFETEDAMRKLIGWYIADKETPSLVKVALFVYDFLSIHPFQDGNGRLSRLLSTLLLLKNGYSWIQFVSFEHEIERRKRDYYTVLMECQQNRPGEDVYPWVSFFLSCLENIQQALMIKMETSGSTNQMTPREKKIYDFVDMHSGTKSGEISQKLDIPLPTVKRVLADMVKQSLLEKHGIGAGTNYTTRKVCAVKNDLLFMLTSEERKKVFTLISRQSYIELKKIILAPLFDWRLPTEWSSKLASHDLFLQITCATNTGRTVTESHSIMAYNHPSYFQPVFTLSSHPIIISSDLWGKNLSIYDYPVTTLIELKGSTKHFDFEVKIVYDVLT